MLPILPFVPPRLPLAFHGPPRQTKILLIRAACAIDISNCRLLSMVEIWRAVHPVLAQLLTSFRNPPIIRTFGSSASASAGNRANI